MGEWDPMEQAFRACLYDLGRITAAAEAFLNEVSAARGELLSEEIRASKARWGNDEAP